MATVPAFTPSTALQQSDLLFSLSPPSVFAYQSSAQTLANNVAEVLTLDVGGGAGASWDTDPTSWTSGANTRIVFNTAGKWLVIANVLWSPDADGIRQVDIRKNAGGSSTGGTRIMVQVISAGSSNVSNNASVILPASVGDYVEIFGLQTAGGNLDTYPTTHNGAVGLWTRWMGN